MARCGARRLAGLGCRRGRALDQRSVAGPGRIVARKAVVRLWVWCGIGERGLESNGSLLGASGRGTAMRARGIIGPMRGMPWEAMAEGVMAGGVVAENCAV